MSLAASLEAAADALPGAADAIRDANGDPIQLLGTLDAAAQARVLHWLLANEPEAGGELAESWVADERGTQRVLEVDEEALPKASRKLLRKLRHRLRSQGVAVAEPPSRERVARLPDVADDLSDAYATALDPRGARLVFIVESNPSGGARLFEALVDDAAGVVDFQVYNAGRSKVREFVKNATRRAGPQAVRVDGGAARALIARAAKAQPADRPLPRAYTEWRSHLAPGDDARLPGDLAADALGVDEPTLAQQSRAAELVRDGMIGPWPPGRERLSAIAESVAPEGEGKLVVSASTREARVDAAIEAAARQLFEPDHAERTAARFREAAFVLHALGNDDDARACLAAAIDLRGDAPSEAPVARAMVERLLAPLLESMRKEDGENEQDSSVLVAP